MLPRLGFFIQPGLLLSSDLQSLREQLWRRRRRRRTGHEDLMLSSHCRRGQAITAPANGTENIDGAGHWSRKALKHVLNFKSSFLPGLILHHFTGRGKIPARRSSLCCPSEQEGAWGDLEWRKLAQRSLGCLQVSLQIPHPEEEESIENSCPQQQIRGLQELEGKHTFNWH